MKIILLAFVFAPVIASAGGNVISPWNQIALKLDKELPKDKSAVYSPLSLWTALAMLETGAEKETKKELHEALGLAEMTSGQAGEALTALNHSSDYEIGIANSAWPASQFNVRAEFEESLRKSFGAEFRKLDYAKDPNAARETVNHWVEEKTKGKIKDLLSSGTVGPDTTFILANAIYFKGAWAQPFSKGATREKDFKLSPTKTLTVPMMSQTERFGYFEDTRVQALRLYFKGRQMFMLILLPKPGAPFAEAGVAKALEAMNSIKDTTVDVNLPRFKLDLLFDGMATKMNRLGILRVFSPAMAQLGGIGRSPNGPLFVSQIVHKAMIDLNESGTEAAAATAIQMRTLGMPAPEKTTVFKADRPFRFFLVHERTKSVLFTGQYFGG